MIRAFAFVLLFFDVASSFAQDEQNLEDLHLADSLRAHCDFRGAARIYERLSATDLAPQALFGWVQCLERVGAGPDERLPLIEEAHAQWPNNPCFLVQRSDAHYDLGRWEEALADLDSALKRSMDREMLLDVQGSRAFLLELMGRSEEAEREARTMLAMDSSRADAVDVMASVAENRGDLDSAFYWMDRQVEVDPYDPAVYINYGYMLATHDRHAEAMVQYGKAAAINPGDPLMLSNRGFSKLKSGDAKGALKDLDRSIGFMPWNAWAYRTRAHIYLVLGKQRQACKDLLKAAELGFTGMYGDEVDRMIATQCP